MAPNLIKPTRRGLLIAGGLAGGALLLGYAVTRTPRNRQLDAVASADGERFVTTWLQLSPDNTLTVYVPHAAMGQGIWTALAMMAAEEMEADWSLVRAVQAPAEQPFANEALGQRFAITDTKNPSVPVRRGVISSPSGVWIVAARKSSALSHNAAAVWAGGITVNSE